MYPHSANRKTAATDSIGIRHIFSNRFHYLLSYVLAKFVFLFSIVIAANAQVEQQTASSSKNSKGLSEPSFQLLQHPFTVFHPRSIEEIPNIFRTVRCGDYYFSTNTEPDGYGIVPNVFISDSNQFILKKFASRGDQIRVMECIPGQDGILYVAWVSMEIGTIRIEKKVDFVNERIFDMTCIANSNQDIELVIRRMIHIFLSGQTLSLGMKIPGFLSTSLTHCSDLISVTIEKIVKLATTNDASNALFDLRLGFENYSGGFVDDVYGPKSRLVICRDDFICTIFYGLFTSPASQPTAHLITFRFDRLPNSDLSIDNPHFDSFEMIQTYKSLMIAKATYRQSNIFYECLLTGEQMENANCHSIGQRGYWPF